MAIQGSLSFSGGGSNAISGVHAGCVLPNGNVIIGDQYNSHANNINEYTVSGAFVRSVYQPSQALGISNPYPGMTNCVAVSASNIIMVIADTWTIQNTKAIQLTLSEGSWNVTHQFSMTNFDTLQGTSGSSIWSLALGRDGYVYFPPMRRATGQLQKLIKCPSSDITENKCELVGDIIPESTLNSSNYTTFTYAVVQIPDTDDLLVALYYRLYRYNAASGAYMLVHSFSDELPIDTFAPRAMVIR
ncbi:MAG TPA: hypothetical protein DCS07_16560 [Bdellovibrionales bacterium]|nr:MAG: hypothetical protein A2Z97_04890 [Bdellovibrionales bacterium GWB1_52_6]OFZ05587.1 MAG: hypothetical protein A2X97_12015 [Bdellovibrionales bacterium GWA1_52_35]OFZ32922.1 MAG: hypothetical protein A2070_03500 [Bdellovibrionales bacterium GWC1_52_8]HAR44218.1 hypothetical protein [Bdellovibrionales bacterium]HCM39042.1 hypothetical protein [Bdellovibrionales bacterium]